MKAVRNSSVLIVFNNRSLMLVDMYAIYHDTAANNPTLTRERSLSACRSPCASRFTSSQQVYLVAALSTA